MANEKLNTEKEAMTMIVIDLIFTFLPIIVLAFIKIMTFTFDNIFVRSDWSYISMILFGQSIIKMFYGISENTNKKRTPRIILDMTVLICLGLVPSIIILVLIETGQKHVVLLTLQIIWLFISVLSYFFYGSIGTILSNKKSLNEDDFIKKE